MKRNWGFHKEDLTLWAITLGHLFTHWYPATFYLLLPFIQKDLQLTYTQMGLTITIRSLTSTLVNLPAGILVDVIGQKGLLMAISLLWSGVPYFFMAFSGNYSVILLCMALVGMGNNLWHPSAISTLSERYPNRRGFAISIHSLGANVGDSIAPIFFGFLLGYVGWRLVLLTNILPGILIGITIWLMLVHAGRLDQKDFKTEKTISLSQYWQGLKIVARNFHVIILTIVSGIRSLTQNGLLTFLPAFLINGLNLSPTLAGVHLTVLQAAGIFSSPLAGVMSDRLGRKRLVTGGMLATVVTLLMLVTFRLNWTTIVVLSLLGFFLFSLRPVIFAWVLDITPNEYGGTMVAVLFGTQSLFSAFAPLIGGFLADKFGLASTFYFLGTSILLGNFLALWVPDTKPFETSRKQATLS